jgi:hypothetical protein
VQVLILALALVGLLFFPTGEYPFQPQLVSAGSASLLVQDWPCWALKLC